MGDGEKGAAGEREEGAEADGMFHWVVLRGLCVGSTEIELEKVGSFIILELDDKYPNNKISVIITEADADALNLIASNQELSEQLSQRKHATIITPHPGEAARLLKISSKEVQQNRIESALKLAQQYNAVCILKGHETIVAFQYQSFTNASGNVGLASGGTGDVLSGIIGSLVAQGLHVLDASKTGVYLHGAAADSLVAKGIGPIGLSASEVALETRHILNSIQ